MIRFIFLLGKFYIGDKILLDKCDAYIIERGFIDLTNYGSEHYALF